MLALREARSRPERLQAAKEQCRCRRHHRSHQRLSVSQRRQPPRVLDLQHRRQFHCSPHKGIFLKYTAGNYGKAYIGMKNSSLDIDGKGDVRVKLPGRARWIIHNVKHVPGLARNLISVGQLGKEGYALQMSSGSWKRLGFMIMFRALGLGFITTWFDEEELSWLVSAIVQASSVAIAAFSATGRAWNTGCKLETPHKNHKNINEEHTKRTAGVTPKQRSWSREGLGLESSFLHG
ncbi:hypothetical protein EV1_038320 [Malus domestica]